MATKVRKHLNVNATKVKNITQFLYEKQYIQKKLDGPLREHLRTHKTFTVDQILRECFS